MAIHSKIFVCSEQYDALTKCYAAPPSPRSVRLLFHYESNFYGDTVLINARIYCYAMILLASPIPSTHYALHILV